MPRSGTLVALGWAVDVGKAIRIGGWVFVRGGVVMGLGAFLPAQGRAAIMTAVVPMVILVPLIGSYLFWRREARHGR